MSPNQRSQRTEQIRRQITRIRGSQSQGMFGLAELVGISVAVLMLLAVFISYFYFLVPAQSRLDSQQRERARLQTLLRSSEGLIKEEEDTRDVVQRITASMEEFEMTRLALPAQGRMDLYEELNQIIKKNGLRNTSGPTYTTLEAAGKKTTSQSTSAKWQSVYPGIAVAVTVEGQYQNLRHFVRDLETSKLFIIINSVELERASESNAPQSADGETAGSRGSLVSLRLDLATYFQRNLALEPDTANGGQE